ncbi:MAG: alpha/beta hydrolase [Nocardiaceae bacterium]|nr:alpha/beta hydrolase [Nocardiaceae bacterium]
MRLPLDFLSVFRNVELPPTVAASAISAVIRTVWAAPTFEAQRILLSQATDLLPLAEGVTVERGTLGGLRTLKITPENPGPGAVLYLHGGGFCVLSPEAYQSMLTWMAKSAGVPIYAPAYRLGPENPFPAAYEDAVIATRAMLDEVPAAQLVIGGDSAGGNLALGAAATLTLERHAFAGLVLLSPFVDPDIPVSGPSDPMLTERWTDKVQDEYFPANSADPRIAPIRFDQRGLPPTLIQVATTEILRNQAFAAESALRAAGVDVTFEELPNWYHSGHILSGLLKDAAVQTERVGRFVRECLESAAELAARPTG